MSIEIRILYENIKGIYVKSRQIRKKEFTTDHSLFFTNNHYTKKHLQIRLIILKSLEI